MVRRPRRMRAATSGCVSRWLNAVANEPAQCKFFDVGRPHHFIHARRKENPQQSCPPGNPMTWGYASTTSVAACRGVSLRLHSVDQRPKIGIAVGFNEQIRQQTQRTVGVWNRRTSWHPGLTDGLTSGFDGQVGIQRSVRRQSAPLEAEPRSSEWRASRCRAPEHAAGKQGLIPLPKTLRPR